ncbi:hypothetical protein [Sphingobium bisphenolivorans]|uniref:hypothetical protein n=1 Tax=Sphingobium bisphenolivorans TaxID=1335760 RepID=UPI0003A20EB9|nr:hypothetical protein [Sphingobium bisphenolivorans]
METDFDLAALDTTAACNKPHEFELTHPVSGAGLGVFWSILGKDSTAYRAKVRAFADQSLRGGNQKTSLDDLEARNVDALAAATVGWRSTKAGDGKVILGGEALEFNAANVRKVLSAIEPIRDQVQAQVNDLGNFMKG